MSLYEKGFVIVVVVLVTGFLTVTWVNIQPKLKRLDCVSEVDKSLSYEERFPLLSSCYGK